MKTPPKQHISCILPNHPPSPILDAASCLVMLSTVKGRDRHTKSDRHRLMQCEDNLRSQRQANERHADTQQQSAED